MAGPVIAPRVDIFFAGPATDLALSDTKYNVPKRGLRVVKWIGTTPATGICEFCSKQFKVPLTQLARTSDAQANLQEQFGRHKCTTRDSASQTAA
jgi:hypothetical protein